MSYRLVEGLLQDIDSRIESAGLTPVELSPSLEKLMMDANKRCKLLEARVYNWSLPAAGQGKTVFRTNSSNPTDKGRSKSDWTVVQAPSAPKPTNEPLLSEMFQTLHLQTQRKLGFTPSSPSASLVMISSWSIPHDRASSA